MIADPFLADLEGSAGVGHVTVEQSDSPASQVVSQADLPDLDWSALDCGVDRSQQSRRVGGLYDGEGLVSELPSGSENRIMKSGMYVTQQDTVVKSAFDFTERNASIVGLFSTGYAATYQYQKAPRMNGAAAQQGNGGPLDHQVAGQNPAGYAVEFEQGKRGVAWLFRHSLEPQDQTIRKWSTSTQRRSRLKLIGPVSPSPVGLAIVKLV